VKVGDLVKYNFGPASADFGKDYWGAVQGDLGVIVDACVYGDSNVADVLWFNKFGLQRSYTEYLEIISELIK